MDYRRFLNGASTNYDPNDIGLSIRFFFLSLFSFKKKETKSLFFTFVVLLYVDFFVYVCDEHLCVLITDTKMNIIFFQKKSDDHVVTLYDSLHLQNNEFSEVNIGKTGRKL